MASQRHECRNCSGREALQHGTCGPGGTRAAAAAAAVAARAAVGEGVTITCSPCHVPKSVGTHEHSRIARGDTHSCAS